MNDLRKAAEMALEALIGLYETPEFAGTKDVSVDRLNRKRSARESIAALRQALAQSEQEWDSRHPKAQALIRERARLRIELGLVEELVDDPHFETTPIDMEYWGTLHDKLKEALTQEEKLSTGNVLMDAYNDTIAKKKPPVKTYAGGKPNYCTPLQSDRIRIDPVTGDVGIGTVDAVNMSQERVDETAKGEHEPTVKWDASAPLVLDCPRCGHCGRQREWVGLTDEDKEFIAKRAAVYNWHDYEVIEASEAKLKEKNNG
jgi:hypothetical protein